MKRASEVPPSVESDGVSPVTSRTASLSSASSGPGSVRKDSARRLEVDADGEVGAGQRERRLLAQQRLQRIRPSAGR